MAVLEFQESVHSAQGRPEGQDHFEEFIAIVDEFIKDKSESEINIDGSTKKRLLGFVERAVYASLSMVSTWTMLFTSRNSRGDG